MNGGIKMVLGIAVGTILFGLTSSLAWADGRSGCGGGGHTFGMAPHGMPGHGGASHHLLHHLLRHQKDIGLTDDQIAKLRALALDQDRTRIRAYADVQVAERELRALVADEKTDLSVIESKIKEREALEANLQFMGIKAKRAILTVLTPAQRDKLKAVREQMRESHRARMLRNQGFEQADHEKTGETVPSAVEAEPRHAGGGLQTS